MSLLALIGMAITKSIEGAKASSFCPGAPSFCTIGIDLYDADLCNIPY